MSDHTQTVLSQFDPQAAAYTSSTVHATGADLARAGALIAANIPCETGKLLDVGCGAGHLSFAVSPHLSRVVASDPSPRMLEAVRKGAAERDETIETIQASAGALPFDDNTFCVVASRYSAHHWQGIEAALHEMRRVVKTGGFLLMIDVVGDEDDLVNTHLQTIELLRDRSHIRNFKASQWRDLIAASGFEMIEEATFPLALEFTSWVGRMQTSPQRVEMIRTLEADAPKEVQEALHIAADGSFELKTGLFWAKAV